MKSDADAMDVDGGATRSLEELTFDNLQLRALPVDPDTENRTTPRRVPGACFSLARPTSLERPRLVAASPDVLALLGIRADQVERPDFAAFFCGNKLLPGSQPAAHCYCGHQFGHFSGQLGDGATMYLGELLTPRGERWEVQFKGAGRTPYSRTADGRKVLRSSLREYLASEANHALGVPTTRAATLVTSDTRVARDVFYDGTVTHERASVITRVAPSFLRFGSFEICRESDAVTGRAGPSAGQPQLLEALLEHVAGLLLPPPPAAADPATAAAAEDSGAQAQAARRAREARWAAAYREMVVRTARLVAAWQCVGFCHGVLNTDNLSVTGHTIDYGPYGFLEAYDPDHICNGSDEGGRYSYRQQPSVCHWNCEVLAASLAPVLAAELTAPGLAEYWPTYERAYLQGMRRKLGLQREEAADAQLISELFELMHRTGADFTHTFRALSRHADALEAATAAAPGALALAAALAATPAAERAAPPPSAAASALDAAVGAATGALAARCATAADLAEGKRRKAQKMAPRVPPAQLRQLLELAAVDPQRLALFGNPAAVQAELVSELKKVEASEDLLREAGRLEKEPPAKRQQLAEAAWRRWIEAYAARLHRDGPWGDAADPAAAGQGGSAEARGRQRAMLSVNPRVVPRNWVAQEAIAAAERGDDAGVARVLWAVTHPFEEAGDHYGGAAPGWAKEVCVT